jgi:alpha-galactosidase
LPSARALVPSLRLPSVVARRTVLSTLHASALVLSLSPLRLAEAAQTDVVVSMAAPPAAPRLLGPTILGAVPNSPLLYTIAASGQRPLTFAASGLPAGLSLDPSTGQIAGNAGAAARSIFTVTAANGVGTDQTTLTLDVGGEPAPTPPMGWNSYDSYGASVTESDMLSQARAQLALLQPFGWRYVVVDFRWFDSEDAIDANGRYLPSISRFPSATGSLGFKPLADQIHAMGLNFGIHIMRGIPRKSVTAKSPIAGSTYTAVDAANTGDTCPWDAHMYGVNGATAAGQAWYDSIFAQYAGWGIDFIKVDDMINNTVQPLVYHQAEVDAIRTAIDKTGRTIVLSLSPGPMQPADAIDLAANATMWRMVNDFWDQNGLSTLADVFTAGGSWQAVAGITVGHWPDADMLPLGYMEPRCPVSGNHRSALTHNQQVSVMSFWALLPSPLIFGGNTVDLTADSTTGPWTTALLTNEEVLAINQDSLGQRGTRIALSGSQEVWAKDLSGGRKAVGLFNHATADQVVSVSWSQLNFSGTPAVRDVWQRAASPASGAGLSATVPYGGALLVVLSPPSDAGAPDASSGTGAADSGAGPGDDSGVGPDAGSGVGPDLDGGPVAGDGDAASPSKDASVGTSATGGPGAASSSRSSGCGCVLAGHEQGPSWPVPLLLGAAAAPLCVLRRRRSARLGRL